MKVGIDQQGRLARTRQTTKSTTYARYIGLYLKHETTNVMDLFTNLFRIIALVRLSLVLLPPPFRNGHQTMFGSISTRQACNEDFVRSGHHFTSCRSDCNPRGGWTAACIRTAPNKRWHQATTEPNRSERLPIDHGQIDAGLEASSSYRNAAPPSVGSSSTKHNVK